MAVSLKKERGILITQKKSREIGKRSVGDGNSCKDEKKVEDSLEVIQISHLAVTIAAVTILMGILLFNNIYAINVVHNQVSESNYRVLNMYMSNVDNCFEAIENYFVGLQSSSSLITAAYTKDDKEFYISQARLIRELEASVSSYDYIEDLFVYVKQQGSIYGCVQIQYSRR